MQGQPLVHGPFLLRKLHPASSVLSPVSEQGQQAEKWGWLCTCVIQCSLRSIISARSWNYLLVAQTFPRAMNLGVGENQSLWFCVPLQEFTASLGLRTDPLQAPVLFLRRGLSWGHGLVGWGGVWLVFVGHLFSFQIWHWISVWFWTSAVWALSIKCMIIQSKKQ